MIINPVAARYNNTNSLHNNLNARLQTAPFLKECNAFDTFVKSQIQNNSCNISFGKRIDPYDEKHCKNIINATALACGALSAASGEAAFFGVEPWLLRGTQGLMFIYMADCLDVPHIAATAYAAREYMSGAYLGCEGSKWAVAGLGLLTDAATGGAAIPVSTATVRGLNAGISAAITKKMGNGFLKSIKNNTMTNVGQLANLGTYLATKAIFSGFDNAHTITDLNSTEAVSTALEKVSGIHKELYAMLLSHMAKDTYKFGSVFLTQYIATQATAKFNHIDIDNEEVAKKALLNAFITTIAFELVDYGANKFLSANAVDTVIDISENIYNYPEVYEIFEGYIDKLNKDFNLDKISSEKFLAQFKNKTFLANFSNLTSDKAIEFYKAWKRKNNTEMNKTKQAQQAKLDVETKKSKVIAEESKKFDTADYQKILSEMAVKGNSVLKNYENPFGFSKIAGYDAEKGFLKGYLDSLSDIDNCDSEDLANAILFYGPRGNGKTTFASAVSEEFGCRFRKIDTTSNKEKAYKRLTKELEKSKEYWKTNKRNSIILLDECTAFMTPAKNEQEEEINKKIADLVENCAQEYHCTLFLTTNYPAKLDKVFIDYDKISAAIPIDPPNDENARSVFEFYTKEQEDIDYNKIIEEYKNVCSKYSAMFSNGQIKDIVELTKINNGGIINTEKIIETIKKTFPEIQQNDLKDFEETKKNLYKG